MSEYKYKDCNGKVLQVGDTVNTPDHADDELPGVITRIDDLDGDYDDELGRGVQIGPYVWVKWIEYEELDKYTGTYEMSWMHYPDGPTDFTFDDLEKVE